jgi:hypothetical protein
MPKKTKRPRLFLETSGVIYQQLGHSLQKEAVRHAVGDGLVEISRFIRMEYLRGVVVNLIEFYFLVKESDSVADALIDWSQKVNQERKLKILLMFLPQWLRGHERWEDKQLSLRRLGDLVVRLVYAFDDAYFGRRCKDRLDCRLGRVCFPRRTFAEELLLRFYDRFRSIQKSIPPCRLCRFKDEQQLRLSKSKVDLYGQGQRLRFAENKGYVAQAERLEEAAASTQAVPKCRWCERLGDSIIVLQAPAKAIIITADRAFLAFGQILNREIRQLPSLAELKRQLNARSQSTDS